MPAKHSEAKLKLFLLGMNSGNRTNIGAAAALYTFVRIDLKMSITQINCILLALSLTSATTDAITANFISRFATLPFANFTAPLVAIT